MKNTLLLIYILFVQINYAQNCERTFNTTLSYVNSEMNLNYNNTPVSFHFKIFQRTNEYVNIDCNVIDIKKPIIICEGFDIYNDDSTDDIYSRYLNPNGYGDQLRSQGYDIITYNLNTPQAAIQPNAICLANFIDFINKNKKGSKENVVMGVSLGGVLARYALVYMENNNIPHNTRLFISFDSPQQGANVPLSIQALSFDTEGVAGLAGLFGQTDLIYLWQTLISNGSQQLISNYSTTIANGVSYPHPLHTSFYNELKSMNNSLGYPQNCKKIALCDGSYKADLQNPYNNSIWGKYSGNPAISFKVKVYGIDFQAWTLRTAPGVDNWGWENYDCCILSHWSDCDITTSDGTKRYALKNNVCPLDHAPGGKYPWFQKIYSTLSTVPNFTVLKYYNDYACFIPSISALDLNTDNKLLNISNYSKNNVLLDSPFDDIWWDSSQVNLNHTVLTSDMGQWLYEQITSTSENYSGENNKIIADITLDMNANYKSTNSITFSNVNIPNNGSVEAKAASSIVLKSGFKAIKGCVFNAKIEPVKSPKRTLAGNLPNFNSYFAQRQQVKVHDNTIELRDSISAPLIEVKNKISIFPTATIDFVNIQLQGVIQAATVETYNSFGQFILSTSITDNDSKLNVTDFAKGLYFIKVKNGNNITVSKFIKI